MGQARVLSVKTALPKLSMAQKQSLLMPHAVIFDYIIQGHLTSGNPHL
jgi:hypothetical protein